MGLFSLFRKKDEKGMPYKYLPIPAHMKSIFVPVGDKNSGFEVTGKIKCPCGNECFEIWESNDRQIVTIVCTKCKEKVVLFDSGKHGWDAVMCGQDGLDRELPPVQFFCPDCGESTFRITVHISSPGIVDFAENLSDDEALTLDDWVNAFDWITVSLSCEKCGWADKAWLDCETA